MLQQNSPCSKVHLSIHMAGQQPNSQGQASLHWLPCKAAQSCDADVAKHFHPTIVPLTKPNCQEKDGDPSCAAAQPLLEASFRGRQLRGQQLVLPQGYKGYVTAAGAPAQGAGDESQDDDDDDVGGEGGCGAGGRRRPYKHWIVRHTFDSLTYWNHDTFPSRSDLPRRVFDWMEVAKQVHQPVTRQQVEEQLLKL